MANLDYSWIAKFTSVGWHPDNIQSIADNVLGQYRGENILGLICTGDSMGNLLGISLSHVHEGYRYEKTIVGFTPGSSRDPMIKNEIIMPENRIPGCLFITPTKFIACGIENEDFSFAEILIALGGGRTMQHESSVLSELGMTNYKLKGEIYMAKFELNRHENRNSGYDMLSIAFVVNEKRLIGYELGGYFDLWHEMENCITMK